MWESFPTFYPKVENKYRKSISEYVVNEYYASKVSTTAIKIPT